MTNLEIKAREFATEAHKEQYRKDRTTPYITHPAAVANLLKEVPIYDENIIAAAWLHDVIEDCGISSERLRKEFNSEVERIVSTLTRNCSREEYKKRIKDADYAVQIVKIADVVHNCSTLDESLQEKTIRNKVNDCKALYFDLADKVHPPFRVKLMNSLSKYI